MGGEIVVIAKPRVLLEMMRLTHTLSISLKNPSTTFASTLRPRDSRTPSRNSMRLSEPATVRGATEGEGT